MDPRRRGKLTRFAAPAAFLAAATVAVILIKAGLSGGGDAAPPTVGALPTAEATTTRPRTTTKLVLTQPTATPAPSTAQYYVIKEGDTLGSIALDYDTTVEALLRLNPDVDPAALHPGDRLRVG